MDTRQRLDICKHFFLLNHDDIVAEIERMQLEIEYDQLKHQLSPRHKKTSVSPGINKIKEKY